MLVGSQDTGQNTGFSVPVSPLMPFRLFFSQQLSVEVQCLGEAKESTPGLQQGWGRSA